MKTGSRSLLKKKGSGLRREIHSHFPVLLLALHDLNKVRFLYHKENRVNLLTYGEASYIYTKSVNSTDVRLRIIIAHLQEKKSNMRFHNDNNYWWKFFDTNIMLKDGINRLAGV